MNVFPFATRSGAGTWAIWLFVLGICVFLVAVTIYLQDEPVTPALASIATNYGTVASVTAEPQPERNYHNIAQWQLFGRPPAIVPIATSQHDVQLDGVPSGQLPESDGTLKLSGVVYSSAGDTSFAIVQPASGKDESYVTGDALPGGVELHKIDRARIVVRRNGRLEEVPLPQWGDKRSGPSSQNDAGQRVGSRPQVPIERAIEMVAPES